MAIEPSINPYTGDDVAHAMIEIVPKVMQVLRAEVRRQRGPDLSVVQLRTLAYLDSNPGATLSAVADFVGLTLPSMSSQVTGMVKRSLIDRTTSTEDRRYITLTLTHDGRQALAAAVAAAEAALAAILRQLSAEERVLLGDAMVLLRRVFGNNDGSQG